MCHRMIYHSDRLQFFQCHRTTSNDAGRSPRTHMLVVTDSFQMSRSFRSMTQTGSSRPVPRKFLGIVGQDPSDSKSNRLHIDIFRCCFHSFESFEVCSIDSSKMISNSPEVSNFNQLFLKLNRFICNSPPVVPEP